MDFEQELLYILTHTDGIYLEYRQDRYQFCVRGGEWTSHGIMDGTHILGAGDTLEACILNFKGQAS